MLDITSSHCIRIAVAGSAAFAMLYASAPAFADAPIWANAKVVKGTHTRCGDLHYLILKADAVKFQPPPDSPGCKSSDETFRQVNVAKAFFKADGKGGVSQSNVDAGYLRCSNGDSLIILGNAREVDRAVREHPAPQGCAYSRKKYQYISSVGNIPFTNVANGGTMSIAESLAVHQKERDRAIAECNASAACRAEVQRMTAINTYYACLKPTEFAHTCVRPW